MNEMHGGVKEVAVGMKGAFICMLLLSATSLSATANEGSIEDANGLAASYFALASNGGHSCGLIVDDLRLQRAVLRGGISPAFIGYMAGQTPSQAIQHGDEFRDALGAWQRTMTFMSQYPGTLGDMCQSIWSRFGPGGSIYPGVLARRGAPYSPDQLQ